MPATRGVRGGLIRAAAWIDAEPRPGAWNMAIDAALFDLAELGRGPFVRLYRWDPHCLSFGRHEPARRRYDRDRIRALGLDCVRRPTGGRAVWHARELTYAVAAPTAGLGGLTVAYRRIHGWLAAALGRLGFLAELAEPGPVPGPGAGACFARAVGGELVVDGFKVLGSAQRRGQAAFLQHGSLLLEDDQSRVREVMITRPGSRLGRPPEAPLSRLAGRPVRFADAAAAIAAELRDRGVADFDAGLPDGLTERAALHLKAFQSDHWTWER